MRFAISGVLVLSLAMFACVATPIIRQATYPPNFHYFEKGEVEAVMKQLADQVVALDELMWKAERTPEDHVAVIEVLTTMQTLAAELGGWDRSNDSRMDSVAPLLQHDLERALREARYDPPNYYFAGEVAGACSYCHGPRHEPLRRRPPTEGQPPPPGVEVR